MKKCHLDHTLLPSQLKHLVADMFRLDILEPDGISDDEPLVGGNVGLDSLDTLELAICVEEEFGIKICNRAASHSAFASIASLAEFIQASAQPKAARPHQPASPVFARPVLT